MAPGSLYDTVKARSAARGKKGLAPTHDALSTIAQGVPSLGPAQQLATASAPLILAKAGRGRGKRKAAPTLSPIAEESQPDSPIAQAEPMKAVPAAKGASLRCKAHQQAAVPKRGSSKVPAAKRAKAGRPNKRKLEHNDEEDGSASDEEVLPNRPFPKSAQFKRAKTGAAAASQCSSGNAADADHSTAQANEFIERVDTDPDVGDLLNRRTPRRPKRKGSAL